MSILTNNTPQDVTPSLDANGQVRLDFADGSAMFWNEAARTYMMTVPNASTPDPTQPAPSP